MKLQRREWRNKILLAAHWLAEVGGSRVCEGWEISDRILEQYRSRVPIKEPLSDGLPVPGNCPQQCHGEG